MVQIAPIDISSFTPPQQAAFGAAAKLGTGVPTYSGGPQLGPPAPVVKAPTTPTVPTPPTPPPPPPPPPTPAPTTAISSDQGSQYATENSQTLATLKNTGLTVGPDGLARYSDSSFATAPSDAVQTEDGTWQSGGVKYALGPSTTVDPDQQAINDQITTMKAQFDDTSRAMIDGIKSQYDQLIKQQTDVNTRGQASLGQTLLMAGSSRYAPISSAGQVTAMMSYGLSQISDLQNKETAAITAAQQAQDSGDMKFMDEQLTQAQDARNAKQKAAQTLSDSLVKANQALQASKRLSSIATSVAGIMGQGVTDPKEILDSINNYQDGTSTGANLTTDELAKMIKSLTPTTGDNGLKFTSSQLGKMYGSGLTQPQVQALSDYYNGTGESTALSSLSTDQQRIVHDALNGTSPNTKAGGATATYTSGGLTYASSDLATGQQTLDASKGSDGYVDPAVYQQMFDAWTSQGGLAKDFLKNYPPKSYVNPANTTLPTYLRSKTSTSTKTSASSSGQTP